MDIQNLVAIDTHVHIESEDQGPAGEAARKYFGNTGVSYGRKELAEYYRSRKIGCVVFSVDERITGRPQVPNEEVAAFAAENSDIVMAFASVDPTRGPAAVAEAKRLIAAGGIRGFKLHPPLQKFHPNDKIAYPLYEVLNEAKMPVVFHTGHSLLKRKVLFGSDYPLITPDRWMSDFAGISIKDEVRPLILKENAVRLFGLA